MQNYELLFILPGTLSEDQVGPEVNKVKELVEKNGGKNVEAKDLGKSRIAYPIKHIRYGYFQMISFEADAKDLPEISDKVRLAHGLLRAVIQKRKENGFVLEKVSAISDVLIRENNPVRNTEEREERGEVIKEKEEVKEEAPKAAEDVMAGHQMGTKTKSETKAKKDKTETKAENIKMEDIDKKLDELLESNIADV